MSTAVAEIKKAIVMKSGLVFWVNKSTAEKIEAATLAPGFQHIFVKIKELDDQTIQTSQIEGFYTQETMQDLEKLNRGEKKCEYGNWHKKMSDCDCLAEKRRAEREQQRKEELKEDSKPLTDEQRVQNIEHWAWLREEAAMNGSEIFGRPFRGIGRDPKEIRKSSIKRWKKENPGKEPHLEGMRIEA